MARIQHLFSSIFYSFPVQLLLNNFRRNQVLLLCWVILLAMVTGNFGKYLGIPYLFLDPEYLNKVNFTSFFIIGVTLAGFTTAFHITCYIADGHRFSFVGTLPRPFTKFCVNNSIVPFLFFILYVYEIIQFQVKNEYSSSNQLILNLGGFFTGYMVMTLFFYIYFKLTNKDIFKYVVCQIDERIKKNVQVTRASAMKKLDIARKKQVRVDNYIDLNFRIRKTEDNSFYDRATIIQVFDQNHFNLVIIELFIFAFILVLGVFKDYPVFQLPAAASFIILLTVLIMITGAFTYWFGGWSVTSGLVIFLFINFLTGEDFFTKTYRAFGLNYSSPPVEYSVATLRHINDSSHIAADKINTIKILTNWRKKFPEGEKPKMVFICVSGGGKRAALWTLTALQKADSITNGQLMNNTMLITGASGGLIGASYFRELKLRQHEGKDINPYAFVHQQKISSDNLNPLIFSLLANDLFVGFTKFEYGGHAYVRDRGYTFEEQLNINTESMMDKPMLAYREPERQAIIPMMILSPTIVNDGRKLYIGAQTVSYMNSELLSMPSYDNAKISGADFQHLFSDKGGSSLRFLSALRMSATFPYITPNTTLPTDPPIQIMDAGISDNFGLSDATRFLYAFHDWIEKNTAGVIILSIRDSPKLSTIAPKKGQSIMDSFSQPISSVYNNFENFQDIASDAQIGYATSWFAGSIERVDIEYQAETYVEILSEMDSIRQNNARASLSWRLTTREKSGIVENINTSKNKAALERLRLLLTRERSPEYVVR